MWAWKGHCGTLLPPLHPSTTDKIFSPKERLVEGGEIPELRGKRLLAGSKLLGWTPPPSLGGGVPFVFREALHGRTENFHETVARPPGACPPRVVELIPVRDTEP